jgi:uncharacterized protein (TIGR04255 family)
MSTHEVFPNAPLQLVVFEVRHQRVAKVGRGLFDALTRLVADGEVDFGSANILVQQPEPPEPALFHIVDRAGTLAITVWPSSLVVERADYKRFSSFRQTALAAFENLSRHLDGHPLTRVGLRYVDEIHPDPTPSRPAEWGRWIGGDLVASAQISDLPVVGFGGGVTIDAGEECMLNFRYSTVAGPSVESSGLLHLRPRPNTPAVILDTDGYWRPARPSSLSPEQLGRMVDRIHDAIAQVFDRVVTDDSRMLFRSSEEGAE